MSPPDPSDNLPVLIHKDGSRSGDRRIEGKPLRQRGKWGLGNLFGERSQIIRSSVTPQQFRTQNRFRKVIFLILIVDIVLIGFCVTLLMRRG